MYSHHRSASGQNSFRTELPLFTVVYPLPRCHRCAFSQTEWHSVNAHFDVLRSIVIVNSKRENLTGIIETTPSIPKDIEVPSSMSALRRKNKTSMSFSNMGIFQACYLCRYFLAILYTPDVRLSFG